MSATDGTSPKFVLLDRAFLAGASLLQACRTRLGRFKPNQVAEPTELRKSAPAEVLLQRLIRVRLSNGRAEIRGTVLAEFGAGERQTTVYIGFCPPFEILPDVEAAVVDDIEADLKLVQVLHNGVQFEIRLSEPAEEALALTVEFVASEREQSHAVASQIAV